MELALRWVQILGEWIAKINYDYSIARMLGTSAKYPAKHEIWALQAGFSFATCHGNAKGLTY